MNDAGAIEFEKSRSGEGWSYFKWLVFVILVFAAHIGIVIAVGEHKPTIPRTVTNVPALQVAETDTEWLALNDPTLFALPNSRDFAAAVWTPSPDLPQPSFAWTETPRWLQPSADQFGLIFEEFMRTNRFPGYKLSFKPAPYFSTPALTVEPALAKNSMLRVEGNLGQRLLLMSLNLPSIEFPGVLSPTRVQVLVNADGFVISAVLLSENVVENDNHSDDADNQALQIARTLRFTPASDSVVGRVIFNWHTVAPDSSNN